jgi:hypothetical protein
MRLCCWKRKEVIAPNDHVFSGTGLFRLTLWPIRAEMEHRRVELKVSIDQQLAALSKMPRDELQALWATLFGPPPNPALRRENLIPILAYRLQEKACGGLRASVAKRLRALAEGKANGRKTPATPSVRLKAGTRIVREWQGQLHEVSTLPNGYEYNGRTWRSLSEIARAITGTRWSGPAFFGVKRHPAKEAPQ